MPQACNFESRYLENRTSMSGGDVYNRQPNMKPSAPNPAPFVTEHDFQAINNRIAILLDSIICASVLSTIASLRHEHQVNLQLPSAATHMQTTTYKVTTFLKNAFPLNFSFPPTNSLILSICSFLLSPFPSVSLFQASNTSFSIALPSSTSS